jgi:hypothetical protein
MIDVSKATVAALIDAAHSHGADADWAALSLACGYLVGAHERLQDDLATVRTDRDALVQRFASTLRENRSLRDALNSAVPRDPMWRKT